MNSIQEMIRILEQEGHYRPASNRLRVGGLEFPLDFDAVMMGPGEIDNIVLLLDAFSGSPDAAFRRLKTLARVLDRSRSNRTLTMVVLTRRDNIHPAIREMAAFCRVVICPSREDLRKALGTLLPLELPEPFKGVDSALEALKSELSSETRDPMVEQIVKAAKESGEQVRLTVQRTVEGKARAVF